MDNNVEKLNYREQNEMLRFLLYHMDMDTRRKLMANMPVAYAIVYPSVEPELLASYTKEEIDKRRSF